MQKHVCYRYINRMCFIKNCDRLCEEQSYFETLRFDGSRCFVTPLSARIGKTRFALFHFSQLKGYFEKINLFTLLLKCFVSSLPSDIYQQSNSSFFNIYKSFAV